MCEKEIALWLVISVIATFLIVIPLVRIMRLKYKYRSKKGKMRTSLLKMMRNEISVIELSEMEGNEEEPDYHIRLI